MSENCEYGGRVSRPAREWPVTCMPKFRLSCRSPDWYGGIDQENLRTISKDERVEVLRLDPLSEKDILAIAEGYAQNPKRFLKEAKQRGVFDLLTNPQTLEMMLQVVESGYWPETRIDIFQKACEIMAREFNDEHARSLPGRTNINDILYTAGALCSYY